MAERPLLLLVHGWGFGPGVWHSLRRRMAGWEILRADLGFYGPESIPDIPADRSFIGIGHSTGVMWLLRFFAGDARLQGLVSINGFARFARAPGYPGVNPRLIKAMAARLDTEAPEVLTEFGRLAGLNGLQAHDMENLRPRRLAEGLGWLRDWDERPALEGLAPPRLVLAGEEDAVVTPAMTRAQFGEEAVWCPDGGHMLPLTHPDWCGERLLPTLEAWT